MTFQFNDFSFICLVHVGGLHGPDFFPSIEKKRKTKSNAFLDARDKIL